MPDHLTRAHRPRKLLTALLGGLASGALFAPSAATAAAAVPSVPSPRALSPHEPSPHAPSPAARRMGIARPGDAYLGWSARRGSAGPGPATPQPVSRARAGVRGIDVSSHQGMVAWARQWRAGKRFAYVKATEGMGYRNPYFAQQYVGSARVGMTRGAYHFALPNVSSGAAQADYFASHGGGWSRDGRTLPGVLDIEYNPYGPECYGRSDAGMRRWIGSFVREYQARTGRYAVIYTTTDWWWTCTGNARVFSRHHPLWIARYSSSRGPLPGRWNRHTFWQYAADVVDQDVFNGNRARLRALALG